MEFVMVCVTVPSALVGERIGQVLVTEKLAACVSQVPGVKSIYRWQGKIEQAQEDLLLIKTRKNLVDQVANRVKSLHPYEVPEVAALPIVGGWPPYLQWLDEETQAEPG